MTILANLLRRPEPQLELVAFAIAEDAYPGLRVEHYLGELDRMAAELRAALAALPSAPPAGPQGARAELDARLAVLRHHFAVKLGFRGAAADYYDPRNSYLNDVIERRAGIPITLAIVLLALGRRVGLPLEGIGFPGHFLVRAGGPEGRYLDPFDGARALDQAALKALAARSLGRPGALGPEHLRPASARSVAERMLGNLKLVHERRGDRARALVVCDRLVELDGRALHRRDRGLHALALGAHRAALDDLEAYLAESPDASDVEAVRKLAAQARSANVSAN